MRKSYLSLVLIFFILILVGTVNAVPISVGGSYMGFGFSSSSVPPPPIPESGGPFTYSSNVVTHIHVWDYFCVGDEFSVYDVSVHLGDTSSVVSEWPSCLTITDPDIAFGDTRFSNGCFDLEPGNHEIDITLKQSYNPTHSSGGGAIRVDEGSCSGSSVFVPEFPSAFLPATMIIGFVGTVLLIQRTREN